MQEYIALYAFTRPPVVVRPTRVGNVSAVPRIVSFRSAVFIEHADRMSAAAPETCGVAIDVPLR